MKNLKLLNALCFDIGEHQLKHTTTLTIDIDTNHVYASTVDRIICIDVQSQAVSYFKCYSFAINYLCK